MSQHLRATRHAWTGYTPMQGGRPAATVRPYCIHAAAGGCPLALRDFSTLLH